MHTITTRISNDMHMDLSLLSKELSRPKGYFLRKAIKTYLEDKMDLLIALSRIENNEEEIDFSEIREKI
ncbi:MAG: antitoxin of toxin-antitoxin stability system [Pseudomonadota bacterium]